MITWRLFYQRISRWLQFFNSLASSAEWSRWVNSAGDAARVNKKKAKFHLDFISIAPRWNFKFMFIDFRWGFSILPFCVTLTCGSFESNDQTGRRKNHTNSGEIISWEYSRFFLAFTSKAAKSPCVWVQRMTMAAKNVQLRKCFMLERWNRHRRGTQNVRWGGRRQGKKATIV